MPPNSEMMATPRHRNVELCVEGGGVGVFNYAVPAVSSSVQ